jgi:DNA polymerase-3 subunit epsilon
LKLPGSKRSATPPPEGPPWDLPVEEAPLALVDLEMTGLDPAKDHVIEVHVERWVGARVERTLSTLVRPPSRAGGSAHVHGIDAAALENAPTFGDVLADVRAVLEGAVFVAHGAEWDVRFLGVEAERVGATLPIAHWVDTLNLSRRAFALPSHALDALCIHFGIARGRAHRAEDDVRALRAVLDRCIEALAPKTPRDLWHVRVGKRVVRPEIVEACARAAQTKAPVRIAYRPAQKPSQEFVMVVTEVRHGDEPPRVVGWEVASRSHRELRADRILAVEPA